MQLWRLGLEYKFRRVFSRRDAYPEMSFVYNDFVGSEE
ncbi:hypothetical protein A2U01_0083067 [Trifolium medium]|uniref:Uncharacterized protein n=1 Tax=Trifolium medium TaxID=97028 RepID=A0A392TNS8_9FABA|nr:hypothetical protein [Trifolium medium]